MQEEVNSKERELLSCLTLVLRKKDKCDTQSQTTRWVIREISHLKATLFAPNFHPHQILRFNFFSSPSSAKHDNDEVVFTSRVCINEYLAIEVQREALNLASPQLDWRTTKK